VEDRVRVVIAEDSVLLREGLTRLLTDRGHDVIAGVGDGEALIKTITEFAALDALPDVVVADVRMPPTHTDEGVKAAVQLRKRHPGLGVLVLSQYVEEQYATELLAGSSHGVGYLLKDRVAEVREFVDAVVRVARGGTALDPEVVAQLLGRSRKQDVLAGLTPREREVLGLMAEGRTNSAIARQLVVSDGAVDRVVIRFAGDSGDGMQLTGDRFTSETGVRQRPLDAARTSPPRSARPPAPCRACRQLPGALRRPRHPHAGRRARRAGRDEPGALKANLADLPRGGTIIVNTDEFTKRNLAKVGYARTRSRTARSTATACTRSR
jgi:DNA-binding NarL/FixJ family response regulator